MAASLSRTGTPTDAEGRIIANYVNVASWRGDVGRFKQTATDLGSVFWTPRGVVSRFQLLLGQPFLKDAGKGSWRVRRLIGWEYARSLTGYAAFFGTAAAFLTATMGPPSSMDDEDGWAIGLGVLRIGRTRYDPMGGLLQTARFTGQLGVNFINGLQSAIGMEVSKESRKEMAATPGIMGRFLQSKLAPAPGMYIEVSRGKDYNNQPVTAPRALAKMVTPMTFNDIYESMIEQGTPAEKAFAITATFGMRLQTYALEKQTRRPVTRSRPRPQRP
jgi:hypothetical protein